jgi:hypothetical protein
VSRYKSIPRYNILKTSEESKHSSEASGATPTEKSYDALTPIHDSLSLCESDPHSLKGLGATTGYQNKGYPQSTIKKNKTTPKALPTKMGRAKTTNKTPRPRSDSHEARSTGRLDHVLTRTRLARRDASTTFRLARGSLDRTPRLPRNL